MAYATASELRTQIEKVGTTGSGSDGALALLLDAASLAIDNYCNRPDGFLSSPVATVRYFSGAGKGYLLIDECTAIASVAVKDSITDTTYTAWVSTDWRAASGDPKSPEWNRLPYNLIIVLITGNWAVFPTGISAPSSEITANWGYAATIPATIKAATIALCSRWYKQGQAAWADTMVSPELGAMIYRRENLDIRMMLDRYAKPAIGGR